MRTNLTIKSLGSLAVMFFLAFNVAGAAEDYLHMAKAMDLPGKFQIDGSQQFAKALYQRLDRAGAPAYLVIYNWQDLKESKTGKHALVVFRTKDDRYYGIDNMTWKPVWLKGRSPKEWASFFSGMDASVDVVSSVASRASR